MRATAILPILLVMFSLVALTPAKAADPELPELLKSLEREGVVLRYLGGDNGLNGWVGFKNGQEQYFYVTPDKQAIVTGQLLNNKGDQVTLRQINALRARDPSTDKLANPEEPAAAIDSAEVAPPAAPTENAAPSKSQQLLAEVEAASWISLGQKTAPAIYSFIDPQCPHCHDMINDFRKSGALDKGQVQLRLVPVGLMNETSLKEAANLLTSPNPAVALYKHMDGNDTALMTEKDPNTQSVQRNMVLMQSWKLDVTPFSIYKNKNGEIKILRGRPANLKALIADLK